MDFNPTEILITKCRQEQIEKKNYYMMASMIVDKAEKNGKLTEEEKRKLNEVIEKKRIQIESQRMKNR